MSEKTIIVKKQSSCLSGCAIGIAVIIGSLVFFMKSCTDTIRESQKELARREAEKTPEQRAAEAIAKPPIEAVKWKFADAIRAYLHDPSGYQPGTIREGPHNDGYAYVQEFRAKNALGAYIKQQAGFLIATNTGELAWTFYSPEALPALISEVMRKQGEDFIATNATAKKLAADVKKAQREIEEMRSKQIIDMAKNYALSKLKDKTTFQYLETEKRKVASDNLYVVRFMGDGRKLRVGILEDDAGELSIVPKDQMKSVYESSTPR
ncbi:MAG: hypothetical protein J6V72_12760 [Kiritimatiellae bacterium]|nr:hypothetical protein [Kiritimatiellia bacterium]